MKTDTFGTSQIVTRKPIADGRGYLVTWTRAGYPRESLVVQGEELSRQFCERVAGGESPINVMIALMKSRAMSKAGKVGGSNRWIGMTAEQRTAHGRAAAAARWGTK